MPSKSVGPAFKVRKKNATSHKRNYRWQSNTAKIAKLQALDAIHKVRRYDLDAEDIDTTTSYFKNGLERWAEVNISKTFTTFKREALPLCDSLPQILHFQDDIMGLFQTHISTFDTDSLPPLLDLLTAFARDLGTRFEKHFKQALELLTGVLGKPRDATVVESASSALTILFKHLSKHISPDLRPTYDVVAPLLGRSKHSPHIVRLTAQSMSFLVTKSAAPSHRQTSLPAIAEHSRLDLYRTLGTKEFELYFHGLMAMFSQAIKSTGTEVHSTGTVIVEALIRATPESEAASDQATPWMDVVCGVLISIVRHADEKSFQPVLDAIIGTLSTDAAVTSETIWQPLLLLRLLGALSSYYNGAKIADWSKVVQHTLRAVETISKVQDIDPKTVWDVCITNTAIVCKLAPMDALLSSISSLLSVMTREPLMRWFVPFCGYFAELNPERFRGLFLKPFHK